MSIKKITTLALIICAFTFLQQGFASAATRNKQTKKSSLIVTDTTGATAPNVWMVGKDGNIFHFNNQHLWNSITGKATDVGVGANGSVWIIGKQSVYGGYDIERRIGFQFEKVSGGAVRIDVGPWGNPWAVNSFGDIYKWENKTWKQIPGKAKDIGIGADGSVWVIGTDAVLGGFGIYKWNGASFTKIDGGAVRIDVGPDGNPWVVNSDGNIYRRNNNQWEKMPGSATDISVDINGDVWIVGTNAGGYTIYRWTKKSNGWSSVGKGGGAAISAGGAPTATAAILGQWKWFTGPTVTFYADGKFKVSDGNSGKWTTDNSPDHIAVYWPSGAVDRLTLQGTALHGKNQYGTVVSATRIIKTTKPSGKAVVTGKAVVVPKLFNHDIVGQWKWNSGRFVNIYPDGKATNSDGNTGTWTTGNSPDIFVIHWVKGQNNDRLLLKNDKLKGENQTGAKVSAKKVVVEFKSKKYNVEQYIGKTYKSEWKIQIKKDKITGKSKWDCCPKEHREDPLKGYVNGYTVVVERDCSGLNGTGSCKQKFIGTIMGPKIEGTCTGDGIQGTGHWVLFLK